MAFFGAGYPIVEHISLRSSIHLDWHTIRESIMLGTLGPLMMWLSLTWLAKAFAEREVAEKILAHRNLDAICRWFISIRLAAWRVHSVPLCDFV
ncbi:MAG: hypothetical protein FVQ83_13350 [Chloroflexi bacterium]|nr:hypothetical protein [Chloroflexota bacterium]